MSISEQKVEGLQPRSTNFQTFNLPPVLDTSLGFALDEPNLVEIWFQFVGSAGRVTKATSIANAFTNFQGTANSWHVPDGFRASEYFNKGDNIYFCSEQNPAQGQILIKRYYKG